MNMNYYSGNKLFKKKRKKQKPAFAYKYTKGHRQRQLEKIWKNKYNFPNNYQ